MRSVFDLFAKSPFKGLRAHADKGRECYELLAPLLEAAFAQDEEALHEHFRQVHELEHEADLLKREIRNALPRSLFLPVDRRDLLGAVAALDEIPDVAEDIAMLLRIRMTRYPDWIQEPLRDLLAKSFAVCESTAEIVAELDVLLEAGFGGPDAQRVLDLIEANGVLEHEADKAGFALAKMIFDHEDELSAVDVMMLGDVSKAIGRLANAGEYVAKTFRLFLAQA